MLGRGGWWPSCYFDSIQALTGCFCTIWWRICVRAARSRPRRWRPKWRRSRRCSAAPRRLRPCWYTTSTTLTAPCYRKRASWCTASPKTTWTRPAATARARSCRRRRQNAAPSSSLSTTSQSRSTARTAPLPSRRNGGSVTVFFLLSADRNGLLPSVVVADLKRHLSPKSARVIPLMSSFQLVSGFFLVVLILFRRRSRFYQLTFTEIDLFWHEHWRECSVLRKH